MCMILKIILCVALWLPLITFSSVFVFYVRCRPFSMRQIILCIQSALFDNDYFLSHFLLFCFIVSCRFGCSFSSSSPSINTNYDYNQRIVLFLKHYD